MIKFKQGYKYQLVEDYKVQTGIFPESKITSSGGYITLDVDGTMYIKSGYCWDGASDPAVDTDNYMEGSLVHDAGYQLLREGLLCRIKYKPVLDKLLYTICKSKGMSKARAWWGFTGLSIGGEAATLAKNRKKIIVIQ